MKRAWIIVLSLIATAIFILSCADDSPLEPKDPHPSITQVRVPANMWTETETVAIVSASVHDAQGPSDIDSVAITILRPDSLTVALHSVLNDSAARGDLIAFDGVYSRAISTTFAQDEGGQYYFVFQATDTDGHLSDPVVETVPALLGSKNEPPTISDIILPDMISVNASTEFFCKVYADDPQGIIDVQFVVFRIHHWENPTVTYTDTIYDDGGGPDAVKEDGIFTGMFTPAFADSVAGFYPFSFQAFDTGRDSTDLVRRDVEVINEDNWPPTIFNLVAPDTLSRSAETALLTVEVTDPQGLDDIRKVFFNVTKPDSTPSGGNPFEMRDDGQGGDLVAGDGVYSLGISITTQNDPGAYIFEYQAEDMSGLVSNIIVHVMIVI